MRKEVLERDNGTGSGSEDEEKGGEQIRSGRCIQLVTIRHRFNSLFWRTHKKLLPVRFHQPVTICNRLLCGCLEIPNNHFLACSFFIEFCCLFVRKKEQAIYEMDVWERVPAA